MRGLYALPPGVDFAGEVVRGLRDRMADRPPEVMASVTIHCNSGQTLRAIEAAKDDSRIKGIYLRMNGGGGVTGAALL